MHSSSATHSAPPNGRRVLLPLQMTAPAALPEQCTLFQAQGLSMGTTWQVKAIIASNQSEAELIEGIQQQLELVVAQMSPWESDSDLMRFNHAAPGTWHHLPKEFFQVLDHAVFVAEQTHGAYEPCIGHLANLWGFGPAGKIQSCPTETAIAQVMPYTDWRQLAIDRSKQSIYQAGGIHLDLCSTAKGYGVDQVARYLQEQGVTSYLVEVGGELRGLGVKPDQQPWWVELEDPTQPQHQEAKDSAPPVIALHGLSVATSGDYNRYVEFQGQRYSHTIDPRTGYPVTHQVCSVTVIHPECMIADALATAISVLGLEQGMAYAQQLQVAARIIVREETGLREHLSPAMLAMMDEDD